ncbi:MAG: hypothetical protein NT007_02845 [Candidatus Kapabacteria bacterium]|nr:hypothetical protein [Candidatus Kapabacteria bacterium]
MKKAIEIARMFTFKIDLKKKIYVFYESIITVFIGIFCIWYIYWDNNPTFNPFSQLVIYLVLLKILFDTYLFIQYNEVNKNVVLEINPDDNLIKYSDGVTQKVMKFKEIVQINIHNFGFSEFNALYYAEIISEKNEVIIVTSLLITFIAKEFDKFGLEYKNINRIYPTIKIKKFE